MENLPAVQTTAVSAATFMPVFDIANAIERRNAMVAFVKQILVEGTDFGKIPGIDKPTLLKPGAEKLVTFFGLSPKFTVTERVSDWTGTDHGKEPLFYYLYKCELSRNGTVIGDGEGSCNSWEIKYRYRWVNEANVPAALDKGRLLSRDGAISEFEFAIMKGETTGQYGKPATYWQQFTDAMANNTATTIMKKSRAGKELPAIVIGAMQYRVPNPDVADVVNTVQKMAQKRALVAAVLIGVNASEYFTQDVEDMEFIDVMPLVDAVAPATAAAAGIAAAKAAVKPSHPKQDSAAAAAFDAAKKPSNAAIGDTDDAKIALIGASSISALTAAFNGFPADWRRPGTDLNKLFMKRRAELAPAVAKREGDVYEGELGEQA